MRAAVIPAFGGPEVLEVRNVPRPEPGPGQVLVRVHASALNRADLLQRAGRYPPPNDAPRDIPGLEFAGEIVALGDTVSRWTTGARVFGIIGGGAHAEYVVAHEDVLAAIPDGLDWLDAGAVPEAFITAHDALVTQAKLVAGERVLVHAVGSGVGLAAVQLVRTLGGVPYGTSRTADKIEAARAVGLEDGVALPSGPDGLTAAVARWTGDQGVDVVLDLVGGPYVGPSVEALGLKGRLMLVGTVAGAQATIDVRRILGRRLTLKGTVLRARSRQEKAEVTDAFAREVIPLLANGRVRPVIDRVYPLSEIVDAHRRMESNETVGKVVLDLA
jgi:putative PIG3 family NAD(P)H quinone oxidoreductase